MTADAIPDPLAPRAASSPVPPPPPSAAASASLPPAGAGPFTGAGGPHGVAASGPPRRGRGPVVAFLLSPIDPATWRAVFAIGAGLFIAVFAAGVITTLFSMGGSLLIVLVGFVLVAMGIEAARVTASVERWRMRVAFPDRPLIPHPYKAAPVNPSAPYGPWVRRITDAVFLDGSRWLDVVYVLVLVPLAAVEFTVAVVLWSLSVGLLLSPLALLVPRAARVGLQLGTLPVPPSTIAIVAFVLGAVLLPCAASATRGLMVLHRYVVEGLLCISPAEALRRDNERLRDTRSAAIELEASELRRIERDLHDGAQQRLVMLAIDLGLAEDKVDTDPVAAKRLVASARDQARQALGDIRDVVRGAAPAILLDRGLAAALAAVAGRGPIPVFLDSQLAPNERLPHAVERAAYYVVSEAITNAAKHARASRVDVRILRQPGWLLIEVRDDGVGGAAVAPGGGLAGLRDRVQALDGQLDLLSPAGGPTIIRVSLPVVEGPWGAVPYPAAPHGAGPYASGPYAPGPRPARLPPGRTRLGRTRPGRTRPGPRPRTAEDAPVPTPRAPPRPPRPRPPPPAGPLPYRTPVLRRSVAGGGRWRTGS